MCLHDVHSWGCDGISRFLKRIYWGLTGPLTSRPDKSGSQAGTLAHIRNMSTLMFDRYIDCAPFLARPIVNASRYSTLLMTIDLVSTDLLRSASDGARELSNDTCGQTTLVSSSLPYQWGCVYSQRAMEPRARVSYMRKRKGSLHFCRSSQYLRRQRP